MATTKRLSKDEQQLYKALRRLKPGYTLSAFFKAKARAQRQPRRHRVKQRRRRP